jgi:hypothetical protein
MVVVEDLRAQELASRRIVDRLDADGFRMRGAYFTPDLNGSWSIFIVPADNPGINWHYLGMHVSHAVTEVEKAMPEAGRLHFELASPSDVIVRAIWSLIDEQGTAAGFVSGYDGIKYVEHAVILRHNP